MNKDLYKELHYQIKNHVESEILGRMLYSYNRHEEYDEYFQTMEETNQISFYLTDELYYQLYRQIKNQVLINSQGVTFRFELNKIDESDEMQSTIGDTVH